MSRSVIVDTLDSLRAAHDRVGQRLAELPPCGAPLEAPDPGVAVLGEVVGSIPMGAPTLGNRSRRGRSIPSGLSLIDLLRQTLVIAVGLPMDTSTVFHLSHEVEDALYGRYDADPDRVFAALRAALAVPGVAELEEVKALGWDLAQEGRLGIHPGR